MKECSNLLKDKNNYQAHILSLSYPQWKRGEEPQTVWLVLPVCLVHFVESSQMYRMNVFELLFCSPSNQNVFIVVHLLVYFFFLT